MSMRACQLCGAVLYGRSDKRYCSSTCRRDASRVRKRTIRLRGWTFVGSESLQSESVEAVLIPRLERQHGPNHRLVHEARRHAEKLREAELEELRRAMSAVELSRSHEVDESYSGQ
jgi:predicted nucleic acid-binding Zn ribbon protein